MAGVLACGMGAVLSHRSAAELWGLLTVIRGLIHITTPTRGGRATRRGLPIHRSPSLPSESTTVHNGIPVTTVARALADLRGSIVPSTLRRAVRQAEYLGLSTGLETDRTRSDAELDFLRLCERHRLPLPEVNVPIDRYTVDFLWRAQRLAVEIDGYAAHRGRQAFEDDRERELVLHAGGIRVRRFSARQLQRDPAAVAASLRADGDFRVAMRLKLATPAP
jgi:very-short-patch-repair endonuclease